MCAKSWTTQIFLANQEILSFHQSEHSKFSADKYNLLPLNSYYMINTDISSKLKFAARGRGLQVEIAYVKSQQIENFAKKEVVLIVIIIL